MGLGLGLGAAFGLDPGEAGGLGHLGEGRLQLRTLALGFLRQGLCGLAGGVLGSLTLLLLRALAG